MSLKQKALELAINEDGQFHADPRNRGQIATIISVVTLAIVALIGILIYSQIQTSMPAPEDSALQNATDSVDRGFADSMALLPVVMLVIVSSLVIGVVQRFG
jgi:type IV secretory pathway VirB2 component (pilin)